MKCRFVRFRISSRLDDGRALSPGMERHLVRCPHCAAWERARRDIIRQLRRTAPAVREAGTAAAGPSPFLRAKILRAIRETPQRAESPAPFLLRRAAAGMAAVAAAAAMVVLGMSTLRPEYFKSSPSGRDPLAGGHSTASVPSASFSSPAGGTGTGAETLAGNAAGTANGNGNGNGKESGRERFFQAAAGLDRPLRRELSLLGQDAATALRGLKSSILPGGL